LSQDVTVIYISEDIGKLDDPASYKEVMMSENSMRWLDAMGDELSSMSSNDVWDIVEISDGAKKVGHKRVYKTNYDSKGKIKRFKAKLVAKELTILRPSLQSPRIYSEL
jgi:hypothetical protein